MNKLLLVGFVCGVGCGCVNTRHVEKVPQPPRQIVEASPSVAVSSSASAVRSDLQKGVPAVGRASAVVKPLRVLVSLEDGNAANSPSTCKRVLQTNLEGALAKAGYTVVYAKPAEILVYGTLRASRINARGTRVAWQGDADMEVTRAPEVNAVSGRTMRDVVAKQRFDAKSGDARSDDEAQKKISDRLASKVADFAAGGVDKVGQNLRLVELQVVNAWQPQDAAGYPTLFTQKIMSLKGVCSCRIVRTDNATRTMTAEVIYDGAEYPDGFLNRLYTVKELNIVR